MGYAEYEDGSCNSLAGNLCFGIGTSLVNNIATYSVIPSDGLCLNLVVLKEVYMFIYTGTTVVHVDTDYPPNFSLLSLALWATIIDMHLHYIQLYVYIHGYVYSLLHGAPCTVSSRTTAVHEDILCFFYFHSYIIIC